jgi:hypothetical protein
MSDGVPIARFDGGGCCGSSSSAAGASDGADDGRAGASDGDDRKRKRPWQEEGFRCPFLDTINRMVLDFDFEKACSVTGNNFNVYACLVCGKYFQGRGKHTQAYTHSLQEGHHVYMNLSDGRVYCLPDGYEVVDASLHDIQNMLNPSFEREKIATLDTVPVYARGVDGSDYMPGLIGLNNIKNTDFVNVVVQSLARVPPLRDFFLLPSNYERYQRSALVREFGALVRKMWSPYAARNSLRRNFRPCNSAVQFSEAPPPPLFQVQLQGAGVAARAAAGVHARVGLAVPDRRAERPDGFPRVAAQRAPHRAGWDEGGGLVDHPHHLPGHRRSDDALGGGRRGLRRGAGGGRGAAARGGGRHEDGALPLPHRRRAGGAALQGRARAEHHPAGAARLVPHQV